MKSLQSMRIFSYQALKEIFEVHGFKVESILGAGYFPLPSVLAKIDKMHAKWLTIKIRKP